MGIWDRVSSTTEAISGGVARSQKIVGEAAEKARDGASWTKQVVVDRMSDRENWEQIGRLGWKIADYAIAEGSKPFTYGIPVYKIAKEELTKSKSKEQPVKEKKENNMELVKLKERVEELEKEKMEMQELKQRMESLEKKIVETMPDEMNQKTEQAPKLMEWCPFEPIDLIIKRAFASYENSPKA